MMEKKIDDLEIKAKSIELDKSDLSDKNNEQERKIDDLEKKINSIIVEKSELMQKIIKKEKKNAALEKKIRYKETECLGKTKDLEQKVDDLEKKIISIKTNTSNQVIYTYFKQTCTSSKA